jgi:hypothetical protein
MTQEREGIRDIRALESATGKRTVRSKMEMMKRRKIPDQ